MNCKQIIIQNLIDDISVLVYALSQWPVAYTNFFQDKFYDVIQEYT